MPMNRPSSPITKPSPRLFKVMGLSLIILLAALAAYLPVFEAGFVFDDHVVIENNEFLHGPLWKIWISTTASDYWPLTSTSFWIEWRAWGENAAGYHAFNLLLHAGVALLFWQVLEALQVPGAWLAGLLFAVHPVTVDSVAWISERKNVLSGLLYLASILAWLRLDTRRPARRSIIALSLFVLALLAKTSVVMLPMAMLGIALYRRGRLERRDWVEALPFFVLSVIFGVLTIWYQHHNAMAGWAPYRGLGERIATMGWALLLYLQTAFVPVRLALVYPQWPVPAVSPLFWLPLVFVVGFFAALWYYRLRYAWVRATLFALGYHALLLLPVLGLLDMAYFSIGPAANHLQYLALMGSVALAAAGIMRLSRRAATMAGVAAVLVVSFGAVTYQRASAYENDFTLWTAAVRDSPRSIFARNQLSALLLDAGRVPEALGQLDAMARLARDPADRRRYRSQWFLYSRRIDEAIAEARAALRISQSQDVRDDAAFVLANAGQLAESIEIYQSLVRESPQASAYSHTLSLVLSRAGRIAEAADVLRAYCRRQPGNPLMEKTLAMVLMRMGRYGEARERAAVVLGVPVTDPRAEQKLAEWTSQAGGSTPGLQGNDAAPRQ